MAFLQPGALGGGAGNGTNITVLIGPESAYILKFGSMHPLEGSMKRVGENKSFHIAPQPATKRQFAGKVQRAFFHYLKGRRHTAVCCAQFMLLFLRWLYVALACSRRQETRHSAGAHWRVHSVRALGICAAMSSGVISKLTYMCTMTFSCSECK